MERLIVKTGAGGEIKTFKVGESAPLNVVGDTLTITFVSFERGIMTISLMEPEPVPPPPPVEPSPPALTSHERLMAKEDEDDGSKTDNK